MKIFDYLSYADLLTILNAFLGFSAIVMIFKNNLYYACILILLALVLDFFDGKVARKFKPTEFGKNLDSFSDTISFGIAPAFLSYIIIGGILGIILPAILVIAGIMRLSRFNIIHLKDNYYRGVPIPFNAIVFTISYFLYPSPILFSILCIAMSILMISDIKIKKVI